MKLGILLPPKPDYKWKLAAQVGVTHSIAKLNPSLTGEPPPSDIRTIRRAQADFATHGITLTALEGDQFDMSRIKLGKPGRDEDIARYCQMLEAMGEAGVKLLCYNFMCGISWYRTATSVPTRGGALVSEFIKSIADKDGLTEHGAHSRDAIWSNWEYFISRVLPVAERAGVTMALHPDDPPIPSLRGIGRIFCDLDGFRRAQAFTKSSFHRITFCQANFKLMDIDLFAAIREFGSQIAFIHFRDIEGTAENFRETFHDDGPSDMPALLKAYHDVGFDGLMRPDHVPAMEGETAMPMDGHHDLGTSVGYDILGRLFAVGYIRGMAEAQGIEMR